jgi:glycosyltransferase involved in cell wall biosynthesis
MARVSVIIPAYNCSAFIKDTIESVLQQTFPDFQLLFIDDGSTDNTAAVIKEIKDPRIEYFYKKNGGQSSARNYGLKIAKSDYIALLDHDDIWPKNYLEIMIKALENNPDYGLAYAYVLSKYEDGEIKPLAKDERYKTGWLSKMFFKGGPCIMPSATVFKRSAVQDFFFDETLRTAEDPDAFMRLSTRFPFLFVKDAHIIKAESPNTQAMNTKPDNICNGILCLERFYYNFGGKKYVSFVQGRRAISHRCRRAAKKAYSKHWRRISINILKKAIAYFPFDGRLYIDLVKAFFLDKNIDPYPGWTFPKPMSDLIEIKNISIEVNSKNTPDIPQVD